MVQSGKHKCSENFKQRWIKYKKKIGCKNFGWVVEWRGERGHFTESRNNAFTAEVATNTLEPVVICPPHYCLLLVPDAPRLLEVIVTHTSPHFTAPTGTRSRKTTVLAVLVLSLKCSLLAKLNRILSEKEFGKHIFYASRSWNAGESTKGKGNRPNMSRQYPGE